MACCCSPCGADTRPRYIYATISGYLKTLSAGSNISYPSTAFAMQRSGCGVEAYEYLLTLRGAGCLLKYESSNTVMRLSFTYADFSSNTEFVNCTGALFGSGRFLFVTLGPNQRPRDAGGITYINGPATYEYTESVAGQGNDWSWIIGKTFEETLQFPIGLLSDFVTPCNAEMNCKVTLDAIGN